MDTVDVSALCMCWLVKISCTQSQVDANAPQTRLSDFLHKAGVLPLFTSFKRKLWSLTSHYYLFPLLFPPHPHPSPFLVPGTGGCPCGIWHRPSSKDADNPKSLTTDKMANLT